MSYWQAAGAIFVLTFLQNVSFTVASRSRNRNHTLYHLSSSVFSNGIWFLLLREMVKLEMHLGLFVPFVVGSVAGSLFGAAIAQRIEKWLGAASDSHIKGG